MWTRRALRVVLLVVVVAVVSVTTVVPIVAVRTAPARAGTVGPARPPEPWVAPVLSSVLSRAVDEPRSEPGWTWPLHPVPEVARPFDPPDTPWGPGHRGVDLAGDVEQPVRATGAGVVTHAGVVAGRGVVVVAHRDGLRTTYEPIRPEVVVGSRLRTGERIGRLDLDAGHCRPRACLHWGLLRGLDYLDPLTLLRPTGPARLLPWR